MVLKIWLPVMLPIHWKGLDLKERIRGDVCFTYVANKGGGRNQRLLSTAGDVGRDQCPS